jgi:hypothetical protein
MYALLASWLHRVLTTRIVISARVRRLACRSLTAIALISLAIALIWLGIAVFDNACADVRITRAVYDQIHPNMTLDQVQAIIGYPPGVYGTPATGSYRPVDYEVGKDGWWLFESHWRGSRGWIHLVIDRNGRVLRKRFDQSDSLMDRRENESRLFPSAN